MNGKPLWILVAVCLYAGCAARPASETQAVVNRIARERPSHLNCKPLYVTYCEVDVDGQKRCSCVHHGDLFVPR